MNIDSEPHIPEELIATQDDVDYDLAAVLSAVVSVRAHIPESAFTAPILGTERTGHGVVIGARGLVLTIGYLIAEAHQVWLFDQAGRVVAGDVLGYDYETGFGLIQALGPLAAPALDLGRVRELTPGQEVVIAGHGGRRQALRATVTAIHEFAGYWEYLIDTALFTSPAHPNWGGAAVLDRAGRLCAIGSLYIDRILPEGESMSGNMSVPLDLLPPILDELQTYGRTLKPARPWLGMFVTQANDTLVVAGTYPQAPAAKVLHNGDVVVAVAGTPVSELASLYRRIWSIDHAGVEIPFTIRREGRTLNVRVRSIDRRDLWHKPQVH